MAKIIIVLAFALALSACWDVPDTPEQGIEYLGCMCLGVSSYGFSEETEEYLQEKVNTVGLKAALLILQNKYGCDCTDALAALGDDGDKEFETEDGDEETEAEIPAPTPEVEWVVGFDGPLTDPVTSTGDVFVGVGSFSPNPTDDGWMFGVSTSGKKDIQVSMSTPVSVRPAINPYTGEIAVVSGDEFRVIHPEGWTVAIHKFENQQLGAVEWVTDTELVFYTSDGQMVKVAIADAAVVVDWTLDMFDPNSSAADLFFLSDKPLAYSDKIFVGGDCLRMINLSTGTVVHEFCGDSGEVFWSPVRMSQLGEELAVGWISSVGRYGIGNESSFVETYFVIKTGEVFATRPIYISKVGLVSALFRGDFTRVFGFNPETGDVTVAFSPEPVDGWLSDPVAFDDESFVVATATGLAFIGLSGSEEFPVDYTITGNPAVSSDGSRVYITTANGELVSISIPAEGAE
ncbi:MAG: hypothetical protein WCX97_04845 [Candidatus Magasanikbacteria bacterium]